MNKQIIYLRNEINLTEHRTPIVPKDIIKLINYGYNIYIQSSQHRIYKDYEYENYGGIITNKEWYDPFFEKAFIVGIKEISNIEMLYKHTHVYFSHTYKNQIGSPKILTYFSNSSSILYDFEYFLDENNKRLISFGFYAGVVGCILGIKQFLTKRNNHSIYNLQYWGNEKDMMNEIKDIHQNIKPKIAIIGLINGNCISGVIDILIKMNLSYDIFDKKRDKTQLKNYDIVYNCILLNEDFDEVWFSKNMELENKHMNDLVIVDISCDYSKKNNPIQIYDKETTWEQPVFSYNEKIDIIAINNLPSLLPISSSDYFSKKCVNLFCQLIDGDPNNYWKKNKETFLDKIK